jgi:ornithine cyclodeaminase/alanine dehydrogenase-like protein (mu-crystallin family)
MALYLTEDDVAGLIELPEVLEVLDEAFRARARGEIVNRPRIRVPIESGSYNLMPAGWIAKGVVGHKTYTASAKGASFQIVLYAGDGSGLLAVLSGGRISGLRTGAVTGLAARLLAATPDGPIAIIGTGFQATMQLNGLLAATGVRDFRVYSRTAEKREAFAARMAETTGATVAAVDSVEAALDGVPVVVTITNSATPVLLPGQVRPGLTIVAAGNNTWLRSEVDPAIAAAADLVVVDDVDNARLESGELMRAAEQGPWGWDRAVPLHDIVAGTHPGRTSPEQLVLCELQGIGLEDVAVAERVYRRAVERGVGLELPA